MPKNDDSFSGGLQSISKVLVTSRSLDFHTMKSRIVLLFPNPGTRIPLHVGLTGFVRHTSINSQNFVSVLHTNEIKMF